MTTPRIPLLVLGASRSGTTLFSTLLDNHPQIAIFPETWLFVELERFGCLENFSHHAQLSLAMNAVWQHLHAFDSVAARVVAEVAVEWAGYQGPSSDLISELGARYSKKRQAKIWGEKTPAHTLRLPELDQIFPEASYIRVLRDPRDILASYTRAWSDAEQGDSQFARSLILVREYFRHLLEDPKWPNRKSLLITYESLVHSTEETLTKTCEFLGCTFDPRMLSFKDSARANSISRLRIHNKLNQPIDRANPKKFTDVLSPERIALIENVFAEPMVALGHQPQETPLRPEQDGKWKPLLQKYRRQIEERRGRQRARRRGSLKVLLARMFGLGVARFWDSGLATTPDQWMLRAANPTRSQQSG